MVIKTTIDNARWVRFCWYRRFVTAVPNTSMPALTAAAMSSPFFRLDQPRSYAVSTECPIRTRQSGAGVSIRIVSMRKANRHELGIYRENLI